MEHSQRFRGRCVYRCVWAKGIYAYIPAQALQKKEPSPFTPCEELLRAIYPPDLNRLIDNLSRPIRYPIPHIIEEYDHPYQERYVYPPIGPYVHEPYGSHHWKSEYQDQYTWRDRNSKSFAAYKKLLFFPQEKILENEDWLEVDKAIEEGRPIPHKYDKVITSSLEDQYERKWKQDVLRYPPWLCDKPYDPPELDPYCDDRYPGLKNPFSTWMNGKKSWMEERFRGPKPDEPLKAEGLAMNFPKTPPRSFGPTTRATRSSSRISYNFDYDADRRGPIASVGVKRDTFVVFKDPLEGVCSVTKDDYKEYPINGHPRPGLENRAKHCVRGPGSNVHLYP